MSKKKLIIVIFLSLIGVGGLIFAGYEFIFKKSITHINSDIKSEPLDATIDADKAPSAVYGSNKLALSAYLRDEGQQTIFLPKGVKKEDASDSIIKWMVNPVQESNLAELLVKQASVFVQGDTLVITNGAKLKDHIQGYNMDVISSGEDLIIYANITKTENNKTFLLFKSTNDKNYIIEDSDNWFSEGIYMIPRNQYTILGITWNSDIDNAALTYKHDKEEYGINTYEGNIAVPTQTQLTYQTMYSAPTSKPLVYQVDLDTTENGGSAVLDKFNTEITSKLNAGAINGVKLELQNNGSLKSFSQIEANEKGEYVFTTTKADRQGILIVSRSKSKLIPLQTNLTFKPTLKDDSNEYAPYQMKVDTPYEVIESSIDESLSKVLGKGAYTMQWGKTFSYKIQPKKSYKGDLTIKNIFGQTATVPLDLYIDAINPKVVVKHVLANNSINILPSDGSFQDVLIQHENIGNFPVEFQTCTFKNKIENTDQGGGLENQLFSCTGKKYTQQVTTKDFVYWKAYRTALSLPKDFPANTAFKVSIPNSAQNGEGNSEQLFVKSDIGIWAKISEKKLYVRGFNFKDNSPIVDAAISVSNYDGKNIANGTSKKGPTVITLPKDANGDIDTRPLVVKLSTSDSDAFIIAHALGYSDYRPGKGNSLNINSFLNPSDVVTNNSNINFRGDSQTTKIYGYSDRGLYKAGETIYFAGFVRDLKTFDNIDYLKGGTVTVHIADVQGNAIYNKTGIPLDEFGGFKGSAPIPTSLQLGDAIITYIYAKGEAIQYSHNIKIKEYQKPTFFADMTYETVDNNINLVVKPQYFFGQAVEGYDAKITWSVAGKDSCAYCRWWNQDAYYYNFVFNDTISTGASFAAYNQGSSTTKTLFSKDLLQQKGYQYTLKADVIIRDKKSDEVQFFTKYIDFKPDVKLGLSGQPYDWFYDDGSKDPKKNTIDGEIGGEKGNIAKVKYEVYYRSYDQQETQQGVDGNTYYLNGTEYKKVTEGDLSTDKNFTIKTTFIDKAGSYLIRVFATDSKDTIIGEVQKQIEYYKASDSDDGLMGALPNNYALTVSIPKKTYEEGEKIPVDILPYQKGAHVIMTVERGDRIVDTVETTLEGSQLSLTAKKGYAPNIVVNVMQLVGTDKSQGARKEPRFYVGYGQAEISTAMHQLNIDVKTDKESYKPGDTVKMSFTVTDSKGNPVDTRLSVGVIDQALLNLYDLIKDPIPYFFNKMGTSVFNYTNMKLLYQSLKAFANNGSKGGGGNGGNAMFSMIRDDLEDTAFWRGGEVTKDGKLELSFTLPDNLTTWVIDVIGITKDTRLGTARKSFISSKDLVIEPNPPQFFTLGDKIDVPVKVIVSPKALKEGKKILGSVKITNDIGDVIDLGNFKADANTKVVIPVEVPGSRSASTFIKLEIAGEYDGNKDGVVYTIPIRSEGLTMKDSVGVINTAGQHTFTIPENFGSTLSLSLSTLPTNLIDPIISNAIFYPYGCTEQLLSNAYAVKVAYDMQQKGGFTSKLLQGDKIVTDNGVQDIKANINNSLSQILNRQQSDGSFGRWDGLDTPNSTGKYVLSTYVYSSLHALKDISTTPDQVKSAITKVEAYLWNYRKTSNTAFLWYLSQKAAAGIALNNDEKNELNAMNPLKVEYGGLLRYTIAAYQNNSGDLNKWRQFATIPTNQDRNQMAVFINQISAYALKMDATFKDPSSTTDDRMKAMQNLLGSRNKQGNRGTTISNIQALKAITAINNTNRPTKDTVTCTVKIGDKTQTVTVKRDQVSTIIEKETSQNLGVDWNCDSPLIADATVSYMPKTLNDQLGADQHVTQMNYSIANPNAAIGEVTTMIGSWTTTMAGEQVAVSIYLPATFKLVDTIASMNQTTMVNPWEMNVLPFDMSDGNCMPTHWETKYDRLFLYYDRLPPTTCDVSISVIKAYNGSTTIMPMSVAEMYRGKVNGRKVILNK